MENCIYFVTNRLELSRFGNELYEYKISKIFLGKFQVLTFSGNWNYNIAHKSNGASKKKVSLFFCYFREKTCDKM